MCCSWSTKYYYHAPNLAFWSSSSAAEGHKYRAGDSWVAVPPDLEKANPLPSTQLADRAVATLQGFKKNLTKPFFLAVGLHKPHLPFVFPQSYLNMYPASEIKLPGDQYPPKGMPPVAWSTYGELRGYHDISLLNATGNPGTVLPPDVVKDLRRAYYAATSYTDTNVGRVLQALEDNGYGDNTVIVLWGDQ